MRRLGLFERVLKRSVDVLCLQLGFAEQALGLLLLGFEAILLTGQDFLGDEALVRELDEVELVVFERLERTPMALDFAVDDSGALRSIVSHVGPYSVADFLRQSHGAVVLLELTLDEMRGIVTGVAAAAVAS
ncbi:MAG TPA: hypothetical protein VFY36_04270 [Solirubrobacteraceae bacterium]|nr:hypothetical protein [Solirubrobacteraceae bacterium]